MLKLTNKNNKNDFIPNKRKWYLLDCMAKAQDLVPLNFRQNFSDLKKNLNQKIKTLLTLFKYYFFK